MRGWLVVAAVIGVSCVAAAEEVKLPPEVTPALRAACEQDVRRLCFGTSPTIDKVKRCVEQKFTQLGLRCQTAIVTAGLMR